jgi:hypothetical protein
MEDDDHERSPGGFGRPGEISPYNPNAVRGPNGMWNEETLPVMEWEAAEHRVVVPLHLQVALGLEVAVLRWASVKYLKVVRDHHQRIEQEQRDQIERCLDSWEWAGPQPEKADVWRVFYQYAGRWGLMVVGRDRNGSVNVVTMLSPKNPHSLPNMIRRGNYTQRHR